MGVPEGKVQPPEVRFVTEEQLAERFCSPMNIALSMCQVQPAGNDQVDGKFVIFAIKGIDKLDRQAHSYIIHSMVHYLQWKVGFDENFEKFRSEKFRVFLENQALELQQQFNDSFAI